MKNILLLTDFSKNSINAIHYALSLFNGQICNYYLLHVKNSASYTTGDLMTAGNESIYSSMIKDAKNELDSIVVDLEKKFDTETFNFETLVDYDNLKDSIKQVIDVKEIDLIIMGTNGVTGSKEVVFGSNTINVIRQISCPTLVVPEGFAFKKINEIYLPLDIEDTLSGKAFTNALKFTLRFSQKIHVLRVKPNNENSIEEKKDKEHLDYFLKNINSEYHVVNDIPMCYVVDCYIQTHKIDLLVLLVQEESLLERFFMGSSTTKISNAIRVPLLVFHS